MSSPTERLHQYTFITLILYVFILIYCLNKIYTENSIINRYGLLLIITTIVVYCCLNLFEFLISMF